MLSGAGTPRIAKRQRLHMVTAISRLILQTRRLFSGSSTVKKMKTAPIRLPQGIRKNDEFCISNDGLCIENDEFARGYDAISFDNFWTLQGAGVGSTGGGAIKLEIDFRLLSTVFRVFFRVVLDHV